MSCVCCSPFCPECTGINQPIPDDLFCPDSPEAPVMNCVCCSPFCPECTGIDEPIPDDLPSEYWRDMQVKNVELEAMVKGYQSNEQRTAPLYKQIAELEAKIEALRETLTVLTDTNTYGENTSERAYRALEEIEK